MKPLGFWNSRRRFLVGSMSTILATMLSTACAKASKPIPMPSPRLGINFSGLADWSTEQPFIDFFKMSREWVSQQKGAAWGQGPALALDEKGWVKRLPKGVSATRIICSVEGGHYPSGKYTVLYEGEGQFKTDGNVAKIVGKKPGQLTVKVDAQKGMFALDLIRTNPDNYIRNIRVIAPGFSESDLKSTWNPDFLKRWQGVACMRAMDMMATNHSKQTTWASRPMLDGASYAAKGMPVELIVDLANQLNADVWCCMPHQADDNYVSNFASYVKKHLKSNLKVWVEYSNEVWNDIFAQTRYAKEQGEELGYGGGIFKAAAKYNAHRSIEIFTIWNKVFGESANQVVKVLSGFSAATDVAEYMLDHENAGEMADVLAIAPYVSLNVSPNFSNGLDERSVTNWSLDQVFQHLDTVALADSKKWMHQHKAIADDWGLRLVAYETGQHLSGIQGAENNDKLTKLLLDANADPRMGEVYTKHLNDWKNAGGDLVCAFMSTGAWSKWGSWGLLQNNDEDPKKSPKFSAVITWAKQQGQKMGFN